MQMDPLPAPAIEPAMPLGVAADLQDHLMTACNDLDRLQTLLSDACTALIASFHGAVEQVRTLGDGDGGALPAAAATSSDGRLERLHVHLGSAVTALQFQDIASQLVAHTHRRLRNCADRLARDTMGDDEDGMAVVEEAPLRPNPVTQDEMDAGSIELF